MKTTEDATLSPATAATAETRTREHLLGITELVGGIAASACALYLAGRMWTFAGALWRDEVHALNLASQPWPELVGLLDRDSAPVLFAAVLKAWATMSGADQDAWLRTLGLVVTAIMVGVAWAGARLLAVGAPLLTLALFGTNPAVIDALGTLKPYGLAAVLPVLALAVTWTALESPRRWRFALVAGLFVLAVQVSYQNAAAVLATAGVAALIAAARRQWRTGAGLVGAGAVAALSLLPYVGVLARAQSWRPLNQVEIGPLDVIRAAGVALSGGHGGLAAVWAVALAGGLAVTAAIVRGSLPTADRAQDRRRLLYAGGTVLAMVAVYFTLMTVVRRLPQPWHYVVVIGLLALTLDAVFSRTRSLRYARLALALIALAVTLPITTEATARRRTSVDIAAVYLTQHAHPGDLVVVNPWFTGMTFARYYRGTAPWMTLPPIADVRMHRYDLLKERMMSPEPLRDLHEAIRATLRAGGRVWLVGGVFFSTGERQPRLPPAPAAPTGWADGPYQIAWTVETGDWLRQHVEHWAALTMPTPRPVSQLENPGVLMARGWRD